MTAPSRRDTFAGGLWNVASMVVPLLSTVLLSAVIARRLGSLELGAQSFVSYVASLVSGLVITAATNCSTQLMASAYGARNGPRLAALARLSGRVHVVGGVVAGLGLGAIGAVRDHGLVWVLVGLVTFIDAVGWSSGSRLIARDGWRAVSPLRLVSQSAASLLGVGAVILGGGLVGVFGAQALTSCWLTLALRRRELRGRPHDQAPPTALVLRPVARLWAWFVLTAGLTEIVDRRVELLFLDAFGSAHDVAVYAVAFSLVTVATTALAALTAAATPSIAAAASSGALDALHDHLRRAGRLAVLAGFLLSAGIAAVGPSTVLVFWGAGLRDAAGVMPLMAGSVLFVPLPVLLTSYWVGMGRLRPVLMANALGALADLGAAAALVPHAGVAGAATANIAAQVVTCLGIVGYTRRQGDALGGSPRHLLRCTAVAAASGGAAWLATLALGPISSLLAMVGGLVTFTAALGLTGLTWGLLTAPDADWLAGTLPAAVRPALVAVGGLRWAREAAGQVGEPVTPDGANSSEGPR